MAEAFNPDPSHLQKQFDPAEFLASTHAAELAQVSRTDQESIVREFLRASYLVRGKAPEFLDDQDVHDIVAGVLPFRLKSARDLGPKVLATLRSYLCFLAETRVVAHPYEQGQALEQAWPHFESALKTGKLNFETTKPFVNRANKVGRNEPCPCGSGKKFKHCCAKLGF